MVVSEVSSVLKRLWESQSLRRLGYHVGTPFQPKFNAARTRFQFRVQVAIGNQFLERVKLKTIKAHAA